MFFSFEGFNPQASEACKVRRANVKNSLTAILEMELKMENLKELTSIEDLNQMLDDSAKHPVLLFKHSLTCPISARAFRQLKSHLEEPNHSVEYNLITVQNARAVSSEAETRLGIRHETPQAILILDGKPVWHTSHFSITAEAIEEAIRDQGL